MAVMPFEDCQMDITGQSVHRKWNVIYMFWVPYEASRDTANYLISPVTEQGLRRARKL